VSFPKYTSYKETGIEGLARVPAHWVVSPLKYIARVQTGIAKGKDNTGQKTVSVPYLRVANVQDGYLALDDVATLDIPVDVLERYRLRVGDVLMNEGGDFDKLGRGHIWDGSIDPCIHQNHVFAVRTIEVSAKWLNAVTGTSYAQFYFMEHSKQSTNLASISSSNLMNLPVVLPPEDERVAILEFIDREVTKIDQLVDDQDRLIGLLQEKRLAVASSAVTKGLKRNVPTRDSGVEWLGRIPSHWQTSRLANLFSDTDERGSDELPVLTVSIHDGVSDDELDEEALDRKVTRSDDKTKYKRVAPGDLVYNMMRAWQGGFGSVTVDGMVSPAYVVARPRTEFPTSFVERVLRTPNAIEEMRGRSRGVTDFRLRLYWEEFKDIIVPLPPKDEVEAIMSYLEKSDRAISDTISAAEDCMSILRERRSALISAAVTGKVDVRGLIEARATVAQVRSKQGEANNA
jgi:type I restriction enzyme, S subunit